MTRDEMRAAARELRRWHERFVPLFGRKEAREHSRVYVQGLLSNQPRKSIEPIALRFARSRRGNAAAQKEVVAQQWSGHPGKTANGQVGVFLTGVTPGGTALLDAQGSSPKSGLRRPPRPAAP